MILFSKVFFFFFSGVKFLGQIRKKDLENLIHTKHIEGEEDSARRAWLAERHGDAAKGDKG